MAQTFEQFVREALQSGSSSLSCAICEDNGIKIAANGITWLARDNTMTPLDRPKPAQQQSVKLG